MSGTKTAQRSADYDTMVDVAIDVDSEVDGATRREKREGVKLDALMAAHDALDEAYRQHPEEYDIERQHCGIIRDGPDKLYATMHEARRRKLYDSEQQCVRWQAENEAHVDALDKFEALCRDYADDIWLVLQRYTWDGRAVSYWLDSVWMKYGRDTEARIIDELERRTGERHFVAHYLPVKRSGKLPKTLKDYALVQDALDTLAARMGSAEDILAGRGRFANALRGYYLCFDEPWAKGHPKATETALAFDDMLRYLGVDSLTDLAMVPLTNPENQPINTNERGIIQCRVRLARVACSALFYGFHHRETVVDGDN